MRLATANLRRDPSDNLWGSLLLRGLRLEEQRGSAISPGRYLWALEKARIWTPQQTDALRALRKPTNQHVALYGAMRSGKTDCAGARFVEMMLDRPSYKYGLVVQSKPSLNRTLTDLEFFAHLAGLSMERKETTVEFGETVIQPVIVNTSLSGEKVRGDTWGGAWYEEAPDLDAVSFDLIQTRLSEEDFRVIYTGNSGPIGRAFARNVLDPIRAGDMPGEVVDFSMVKRKNRPPSVDNGWFKQRVVLWKGTPMYDWYVLGQDAAGAGSMFPHTQYAILPKLPDNVKWLDSLILVDPGWSTSATHALLLGSYASGKGASARLQWVVLGEWYHRGADSSPKQYAQQVQEAFSTLGPKAPTSNVMILVDQSDTQWESHALDWLRQDKGAWSGGLVESPKGTIDEGIRIVQGMLGHTLHVIDGVAPYLEGQLEAYTYEIKAAQEKGADKVDQTPDPFGGNWDGIAALRYGCVGISAGTLAWKS